MNMYVLKSICSLYGTLSSCLLGNLGQYHPKLMMDLNTTLGSPKEQPSDPHTHSAGPKYIEQVQGHRQGENKEEESSPICSD